VQRRRRALRDEQRAEQHENLEVAWRVSHAGYHVTEVPSAKAGKGHEAERTTPDLYSSRGIAGMRGR
jgi:hypothetical protein